MKSMFVKECQCVGLKYLNQAHETIGKHTIEKLAQLHPLIKKFIDIPNGSG